MRPAAPPLCASLLAAALVATGAAAPLAACAQAAAPAPPPGGPGVYRDAGTLAATLKAGVAKDPALAVSQLLVTDRYSIQEVYRGVAGAPAIHEGWSELHFILEGDGVLLTGGRIVPATNGAPARIEGGVAQAVHKGDAVVLPPDTPHQYSRIDRPVTYLEVRFPDPTLAKP